MHGQHEHHLIPHSIQADIDDWCAEILHIWCLRLEHFRLADGSDNLFGMSFVKLGCHKYMDFATCLNDCELPMAANPPGSHKAQSANLVEGLRLQV